MSQIEFSKPKVFAEFNEKKMKSEKPLPQPQTKPEHPIRKLPDIINVNRPSADSNDSVVKTIRNKNGFNL